MEAMAATPRMRARDEMLRDAFEEHYVLVVRLLIILTGRQDVAEDLAQEAFVRLAPKIQGLSEDAVGPYVRRIGINLWKNHVRRLGIELRARRRESPRPADAAESVHWRVDIARAVRRLPRPPARLLGASFLRGSPRGRDRRDPGLLRGLGEDPHQPGTGQAEEGVRR
jgi:DNA-directed RNA polymerase specialized sigma24 family protein